MLTLKLHKTSELKKTMKNHFEGLNKNSGRGKISIINIIV